MKVIKMCLPELKSNASKLVCYYLLAIANSLLLIFYTYLSGQMIDYLVNSLTEKTLLGICGVLAFVVVSSVIIGYFVSIVGARITSSISYGISNRAIRHLHESKLTLVLAEDSVSLSDKIINDSANMTEFCVNSMKSSLVNILNVIIPTMYLAWIDYKLLFLMASSLLAYVLIFKCFQKPLYRASLNYQNSSSEYLASMNNQVRFTRAVKVNALYDTFTVKLKKSFQSLYKNTLNITRVGYFFSGLDSILSRLMQVAIIFIGGLKLLKHEITVGDIIILMNFFGMAIGGFRYFLDLGKNYQESKVSCDRMMRIFGFGKETNGEITIDNLHTIEIEGISVDYGENRFGVSDFSEIFSTGNIYGIIGNNGSGKSTLLYGLLGLFIGDMAGTVKYNGIPIEKIDLRHFRRQQVSMLEQDDLVDSETINELIFSDTNSEERAEIDNLMRLFEIQDFISQNGNRTVGSTFSNISGGQRKKLLLIRALAKKSSLLILDEPTASLDYVTTQSLYRYLKNTKCDRIIILVSHDNTISSLCDTTFQLAI